MTQPRVHGRFATSKQAAEYRQKFQAVHGELRSEIGDTRARFVVNLIGGSVFALGALFLIVRAMS